MQKYKRPAGSKASILKIARKLFKENAELREKIKRYEKILLRYSLESAELNEDW